MIAPATVPATRREIFAWAMYDFANSSYTTNVLTAIFGAYFVRVVVGDDAQAGASGTLLWTVSAAVSNLLVLVSAPVVGAIADCGAHKKRLLAVATVACVILTAGLALVGRGDIVLGMVLLILSGVAFSTGENLIAGFLPELVRPEEMGRISGYGWSLGYLGGLVSLALCLAYVQAAEARGHEAAQFVPGTMLITAGLYGVAAVPTFLWLGERTPVSPLPDGQTHLRAGFARVRETCRQARRYRDLFCFLVTLAVYYCGIHSVIALAAVYAQQVMGFDTRDTIYLVLVVNATAAVGALAFGFVQDLLGSVRTLAITLVIWMLTLACAYFTDSRAEFWIVANLIGIALGSSQSAGRALVGQFSPPGRSAEFFGLWGLAGKAAAVVGPLTYGLIVAVTGGNHRLGLLAITVFFAVGLALLLTVNEARGRAAAR